MMTKRQNSRLFLWWRILTGLLFLVYLQPTRSQGIFNPVDLLEGRKKVIIPFTYTHNFIILEARMYGLIPIRLIFDTGSDHVILFKREYTDLLGVEYDKRIQVMGSDLSRELYALIARNGLLEVKGLSPRKQDFLILEESYFELDEMIGLPVAGLIGGSFFRNLVVNIDYRKRKLTIYDPAYFKVPHDFVTIPSLLKTNKPYITCATTMHDGSQVELDLLVDTGAGIPLLLHTNSHSAIHLPEQYIRGQLGMGLGGYLEGYTGRTEKLSLGEFDISSILTSFQDINPTWLSDKDKFRHGIVGNALLSRFNLYIDYTHGQLHLKPTRDLPEPFSMDRSGLVIFAYGLELDQYIVKSVLENSPAADAGILEDDLLVSLRGIPVKYYTLEGIHRVFQKKSGKKIRMVIDRSGQKLRKEIMLRDLI